MTDVLANKRIAITGGGTGGHLYPGIAVASQLRRLECELLYLGSPRGLEAEVVPKVGFPFLAVPSMHADTYPSKACSLRPQSLHRSTIFGC